MAAARAHARTPLGATTPRLACGDPLRALAALGILLLHVTVAAGQQGGRPAGADAAVDRFGLLGRAALGGGGGLVVFFVLSGFLISRPFAAAWWAKAPRPSLRRYARHRALRIVPPFYVVVLAVTLVFGTAGSSLGDRLVVPAFAQGFHESSFTVPLQHAWSLDAEAIFYVLLGVAGGAIAGLAASRAAPTGRRALVAALGGLGLLLVLGLALRARAEQADVRVSRVPWYSLVAFLPGVALAVLEQARHGRPVPRHARRTAWMLAVGGTVCLLGSSALPDVVDLRYGAELAGAFALLGGIRLSERAGPPWRLLDNRPLHWLGARAYGIYLIHYPIVTYFALHLDQTRWWHALAIMLPATLAGAIAGAHLLHVLVERPALAFRDGWPGQPSFE